jgi:uncharacterized protein (DUF3820 family)
MGAYEAKLVGHMAQHLPKTNIQLDDIKGEVYKFLQSQRVERESLDKANFGLIGFGKYKGRSINDVNAFDRPYLEWMATKATKFLAPSVKEELIRLNLMVDTNATVVPPPVR